MSTDTTAPAQPGSGLELTEAEEAERWADLERRVARSTPRRKPGYAWALPVTVTTLAGMTLHRYVPHPAVAVTAVAVGLALVLAMQSEAVRLTARNKPAPDLHEHLQELDDYTAWLPRRIPAVPPGTLDAARRCTQALAGNRWRAAHVLIARRGAGPRAVAQCLPVGDRLELILDDYYAENGSPEMVGALLAHEVRHCGVLTRAVHNLSGFLCQPGPVLVAMWALSWPASALQIAVQAIVLATGLKVAATLIFFAVEVSCDLGAAADQGVAAENAAHDAIAAEDSRMKRSFARCFATRLLNWGAPPPHPPLWLRRAVVRIRYGNG